MILKNALHPPAVIISHQAPRHLSVKQHTITHDFHPLPDRDRSRIASGLSVRRLPPVHIIVLLIVWVGLSADKAERFGASGGTRTPTLRLI